MQISDNVKFLLCLNDIGMDKAYELLTSVLKDPKYFSITPEQHDQKTEDMLKQSDIEFRKKIKAKEANILELNRKYKFELRMVERCIIPWTENVDFLKAIDTLYDDSYWKVIHAFEWGFIQGKKAERARRKKVTL